MKSSFFGVRSLFLTLTILLVLSGLLWAQEPTVQQNETQTTEVEKDAPAERPFVYSPQGRRDPFEPLLPKEPLVGEVVKKTRPEKVKGPLEKFELKQFRLIAIMIVKGTPRAMVKAPDGKSYMVKVHDYIGMNGGVVKDIQTKVVDIDQSGMRIEKSPDRIVVEEAGVDSVTGKEVKEDSYIVM